MSGCSDAPRLSLCLKNWCSINIILFLPRKLKRHYYKVCQTPVHSTGALQLPRKHCTVSIQLKGQFIPQMGFSFLVNRNSFFSSAPEYEPARKVRVVSSTKTRGQLQSKQQHSEEEATFESPQAQPQPHQELNNSSQEVGSMILYPQLNRHCTPSMMYDTKAHVAQCPPKNTCYCYCGRGGMQMVFINVLCVNIRVTILDMSQNIIEHNTCMSTHMFVK